MRRLHSARGEDCVGGPVLPVSSFVGRGVSHRYIFGIDDAIIAAGIGAAGSLLGGKDKKAKLLQSPGQRAAEDFLTPLMKRERPNYPTAPVVGASELQEQAFQGARDYASSTPEGFDYLRSLVEGGGSFADTPEIQALLEKVREAGSEETNRVGRSLQKRGGATSSTGRDMLGRSVEDMESNILASLAPYAEAERGRKMSAANILSSLGENATLNRLNALSTQGALQRNLEQLRQQADYERKMKELNFPYEVQAGVASTLLGVPRDWQVTGGEPSVLTQLAPFLGTAMGGIMNGGGGSGGGGSGGGGGSWADNTAWMNNNAQAWNMR